MSILKVLLLAAVFLTPLLGSVGDFGYEQIKVLFFIFSISLIGFVWFLKKPKLEWTKIKTASFVFILVLLFTSITGINLRQSFFGIEPYFQGWLVYSYLFLFSIIISSLKIKFTHIAFVLSASATIVSLLAIEDWVLKNFLGYIVPNYADRVVSTFGQPNFYAGFLLLTLPFAYLLIKSSDKKLRIFGFISEVVLILGIIASYSRTAMLMGFLLMILGLLNELKMRFKLGLSVAGIIIVSVFITFSGIVGNEISQPVLTKNPDLTRESVEKRAYLWPQAVTIAWQRPFFGYGLENIGLAFNNYFVVNKHSLFEENLKISPVLISLKELNIDRSHNYLLDLLLFSGILGLSGWLGLIWVLFGRARNVLLVSLITYLVWTQFQNQSIVHLIYFWLLVGLIDRNLPAAY